MSSQTIEPNSTDDIELFKRLMERPKYAWATIFLFCAAIILFAASCYFYLTGALSVGWAVLFNCLAAYMAFTVAHDATHSAVSTNRKLNDWLGRLSTMLLEPAPAFGVFRFVHMQHHKFTNDPERDPDSYAGKGASWLLPFKWATLDFAYFTYYLNPHVFTKRPKSERREFYLGGLVGLAIVGTAIHGGWLTSYLLLHFLPTRIIKIVLTLSFDFLPHYPHHIRAQEDPYKSTSNRLGFEWLLTPLFLYQNYHLVHHLYPTAPFYRNLKLWRARRHYHEANDPALVDAFSLKPKSTRAA